MTNEFQCQDLYLTAYLLCNPNNQLVRMDEGPGKRQLTFVLQYESKDTLIEQRNNWLLGNNCLVLATLYASQLKQLKAACAHATRDLGFSR